MQQLSKILESSLIWLPGLDEQSAAECRSVFASVE